MSPINIPIKPPPRVNTADGINGSSGRRETERARGEEEGNVAARGSGVGGSASTARASEREKERGRRERDRVRNPIRSSAGLL